ncbi:MAG: flagellar basal body P-ring protein FlgI [Gemmatimonadetes bacterium]|nr:flagellar basal body P-ring protein FlgI [Gemmatimonadota bacterium]
MLRWLAPAAIGFVLAAPLAPPAHATPVRIKDLVTIEGADPVEVYGYGLVVGLNGTGDGRTISYTRQSLRNLLERMGLTMDDDRIRAKNIASVMVTSSVSPFDQTGTLIDVQVSSLGDATSLAGGLLLLTELRGPDGRLYGTAQGSISTGGYEHGTRAGAGVRKGYVTTGRVPEGARIILSPTFEIPAQGDIHLFLDEPDFTMADRVAQALRTHFGDQNSARAIDAGKIALALASLPDGFTAAMASLEDVAVEPTVVAKIVINERTGTLVAGGDIRIQPATVSHGSLSVRVETANAVSQPPPFSTGTTTAFQNAAVDVGEGSNGGVVSLPSTTTADELATALNGLGVSPQDLISIFQALKQVGAIPAKMEVL